MIALFCLFGSGFNIQPHSLGPSPQDQEKALKVEELLRQGYKVKQFNLVYSLFYC